MYLLSLLNEHQFAFRLYVLRLVLYMFYYPLLVPALVILRRMAYGASSGWPMEEALCEVTLEGCAE